MENQKLAIIGAGSMGKAILSGLIASGIAPENITASTASSDSASALKLKFSITALANDADDSANAKAAAGSDIILIAVKPNQVIDTLEQIKDSLNPGTLIISVAAGITTSAMEQVVGESTHVVRAMPNTPALVGHAVTGIAKGKSSGDSELSIAKELFETVGQVLVVDEDKINALSTISGSGPAYVFYFAEKLINAAKELGFSDKEASLMVGATFLGSATLMASSTDSPKQLRAQVTSPNGTTMQATARFDEADLEKIFIEATQAALARAIEIGNSK